jgi:hypothetical protein
MDDIGRWNQHIQASLARMAPQETELVLEFNIPLQADMAEFRVGWSLKRPGGRGWVAISTGRAVYDRFHPNEGIVHLLALLEECNRLLEPQERL